MPVEIPFTFLRDPKTGRSAQEEFFNLTCRNTCFSGGYGNGKTTAAILKALFLSNAFPGYRTAIVRRVGKDLRQTTMKSFFKICPPELYDENKGGRKNEQTGEVRLINGSEFLYFHLSDENAEGLIRGLEINSVIIDQAEEVGENEYLHLDTRVGRWDGATIPKHLNPENYPKNPVTGKAIPPSYMMVLCNPDSEYHWIFQRYHPESKLWQRKYSQTHKMISAASDENPTLSQELIEAMYSRDEAFTRRFVKGLWGIPEGRIHNILEDSILEDVPEQFLEQILTRGALYRVLDHGDSAPTCCLWFAAYKDWHFCYREYYKPDTLISEHRRNIEFLSRFPDGRREVYMGNYADPQIFKKTSQKYGGFWGVADEYQDPLIKEEPIMFLPADNNEMFCRSRVNEMLKINPNVKHPITGKQGAPTVYFLYKTPKYENGCEFVINESRAAKRKMVGTVNGRPIFAEEREDHPDHAYDCLRYYSGVRPMSPNERMRKPEVGSFFDHRKRAILQRDKELNILHAVPGMDYLYG